MYYQEICRAAAYIRSITKYQPDTAVILGSGLGSLADHLTQPVVIPYAEIPGFPHSSLAGHADQLVIGSLQGRTVAMMQGRFHYYEGLPMRTIAFPVYVLKQLGVRTLIITNACGGINRSYQPGDLMLITDYINTVGNNSLIGENDERLGPRFPDLSEPYDHHLIEIAEQAARELHLSYQKGVYALFSGPCYETAAEIRALAVLGADAVGMSTVPETIAANYLGMKVLGIACITNMGTGIAKEKHSHEQVLQTAAQASQAMCDWISSILPRIPV